MYATLLLVHSWVRWLVLISLLTAIFRAFSGWKGNKIFTSGDSMLRALTVTIVHIQFVLGVCLYFVSPTVNYFLHNFKTAVQEREARFFGMEHITMMVLAVTLITIGGSKAKRKQADADKFKMMAIWFTIGLVVIFLSIPWQFSPLTSRPLFRTY